MTEPVTIVEIDLPMCARVFGTAPCTAALSATTPRKCFNTRATCADPAHYLGTATQTLRFGPNQMGLPPGQTIFPTLGSVSTNPAEINLSGVNKNTSPLGKRERVTITLTDFRYHDTLTDPYQSQRVSGAAQFGGVGYSPEALGTFWGRTLARHPYHVGKTVRVRRGEAGAALSTYSSASYVIDKIEGPDASGRVTITAKDILDLADNNKAVVPAVSSGKLLAAITATDTTATLTPSGIGSEYGSSGKVCIGREVCAYTRTGDVLTLTRGQDGTAAASHAISDTVQECAVWANARPCDVVADILTRAGVSAAFIDTAAWQAENDRWMRSVKFNAIVTKSTGAAALLGEICQHGIMIWWDGEAQEIRYRANRPLDIDEAPYALTDTAHFLADSVSVSRDDEQRITVVNFHHGISDPTGSTTDAANFDKANLDVVPENLYDQVRIVSLFSRWFGASGDETAAAVISTRLRNRYKDTPKTIAFTVDAKDRAGLPLGQVVTVQTAGMQEAHGAPATVQMQVNSAEVKEDRVDLTAETWAFTGRYAFLGPSGLPDYPSATAEQKRKYVYLAATHAGFADGTPPYILF